MSSTLLDGVNRVLIKVSEIESRDKLTELVDTSRQVFIDTAVDSWNEVVDELYLLTPRPRPRAIKARTIVLVDGQREYRLHSSLVTLRFDFHLIDEANDHTITLVEDGYRSIIFGDLGQDDTGLPSYAALNPESCKLIFDRIPTAADAGKTYKYRFEKDLEMNDATDVFPFSDTVFRSLVGAVAEKWKFENRQDGDMGIYKKFLAQAAARLRQSPWRLNWAPRRAGRNATDPFVDVA